MTDVLGNALIAACVTVALAIVQAVAARKVAAKVEDVAKDLKEGDVAVAEELVTIRKTGENTHVLVNSAHTSLLRLYALAMRRVADLSGHADDKTLAKLAEEAWKKNVDSQPPETRESGKVFHGQKD